MKVSVILPNYNHAPYLKQRIDSILTQTYQNFELIILDDCSTDNSKEVIEIYRTHPKVAQIVYNATNSGITFKQWEKGIRLTTGELVWIAESDDWCETDLVETIVEGFLANPACVLGYVQSYTIRNGNDIVWQSAHTCLREQVAGPQFINQYMVWRNTIFNASMAIFKKAAYCSVSDEYTTYRFGGDWVFWIAIARQGDVFISGKLLNFFRKHGKDVSGKAYASGLDYIEDLRVLNSLWNSHQIEVAVYKTVLADKYWKYLRAKKDMEASVISTIEKLFDDSGYKKYVVRDTATRNMKSNIKKTIKRLLLIK